MRKAGAQALQLGGGARDMGAPHRFGSRQRRLVGEHGQRAVAETRGALQTSVGLVVPGRGDGADAAIQ